MTWGAEVEGFLTHLAVASGCRPRRRTRPSGVLFLYKRRFGEPLPWLEGIESAKRPARLPVVLTREEVESILAYLSGTVGLMIRLRYGTGMRIMECVRLRVKDVDFARGEIVVRRGKGAKDRMTVLPQSIAAPLRDHLVRVKKLHEADLEAGYGEVCLSDTLSQVSGHSTARRAARGFGCGRRARPHPARKLQSCVMACAGRAMLRFTRSDVCAQSRSRGVFSPGPTTPACGSFSV